MGWSLAGRHEDGGPRVVCLTTLSMRRCRARWWPTSRRPSPGHRSSVAAWAMETEVAVVEVVKAMSSLSPAQLKVVTKATVLHSCCTEDTFSQVISPPPPCKRGRLFSEEARRCRRRILPDMATFGTIELGSHNDEEGLLRVPRSPRPNDASGVSNVEYSLLAPELRLHIAVEVISHLRLALAVATELQATVGLPTSPLVAKELLAAADAEDSPSVEVLTPELQLDIAL
jgi:hypothetical protein